MEQNLQISLQFHIITISLLIDQLDRIQVWSASHKMRAKKTKQRPKISWAGAKLSGIHLIETELKLNSVG